MVEHIKFHLRTRIVQRSNKLSCKYTQGLVPSRSLSTLVYWNHWNTGLVVDAVTHHRIE